MILPLLPALPAAAYVAIALVLTHITIVSVTIFLHRHQSHRSLTLHPVASHFFRFWLWLTTGTVTREWVAVHRKHHAKCETEDDPHSPVFKGIGGVLFKGVGLYRQEARNLETLDKYGSGTPDDWLERHVYSKYPSAGILVLLPIELALFGLPALAIYAVQMLWVPFWAAGVINGVGHFAGYRNFETNDVSMNILPWGVLVGGEELHNNHHAYPASAKLSNKWWELDIGWVYIRLLALLGLAEVKRVAPSATNDASVAAIDLDTVRAVLSQRFRLLKRYTRRVINPAIREARANSDTTGRRLLRRAKKAITGDGMPIDDAAQATRDAALQRHDALAIVYGFKEDLKAIWTSNANATTGRLERLRNWCIACEHSGSDDLVAFAAYLRGYRLSV